MLDIMNPDNYIFNGYALPMFIAAAAIALLGLFILFRERGSSVGFSFLFMCLSVGLYLFATGANYASRDEGLSLLWIRISQLGSVFIPTTILLLTANRLNLIHRRRFAIASSFALSTFFALAALFTDLYVKGSAPFFWGRFVQYGPLGFVFLGFFFGIMVFVLRLYWLEYRQSSTERQKKRLRGLLIAFSGGYLGSVDFLPAFGLPVYPFGYLPICFFVVMSAYVIIRYRFTDITPELAADRILETMQGAVIVSDLKGRIRVINCVAEEMLGYQKAELLGRDIESILPSLAVFNTTSLLNGKSYSHEMTWHSRSGQQFDVNISVSAITNLLDNAPVGIVYTAYDITERKKAEESLRRSEESYRGLFNGVGEAIFVQDRQGRFLDVNAAAERLYGYPPEYFIGKSPREVSAPGKNDFKALAVALEKAFTGEQQRFEFWGQRANGEVFPKEVRLVRGAYGGQDVIFASADDITERKRMENALQSSEARFRTIIENASTGILVVDVETRYFRYANPEICRMLGYSHDELMALDVTAIHPMAERSAVIEKFAGDQNMLTVCNMQTACLRKDGTVFPVDIKSAILELDGKLCHAGFFTDISERRLLEEEQLKTQKLEAIGTLAGGIAHDFNNLLQGVFGYISLAKMVRDDGEKTFTALEQAEKALHMSVRLTNQLLTFAKGGQPLKKPINLWPVIENAAKFALSGSRSDYRIVRGDNLWQAEADEGQIGQVIQNIVLNADQAMPQGGRVEITIRNVDSSVKDLPKGLRAEKYIEIAVKDNGIGIPEQYLGRIFDPYFTTKERGSGLGLATSYSIITNHDGLIEAKSEVGKGTTFFVYLPALAATQKEETDKPITTAVPVRAGKILVMDDEPVIRAVAGELISALGHRVEFATRGEEAIEKYEKARQEDKAYDVVILDLTIRGGMGGAETVLKLKEIDDNVTAVVSSGYSDDAVISHYRVQGFKAFLKKPYNVDDLRRVLNTLLMG